MILIDGRPLQTFSKYRGIGRFTKGILDSFREHNKFYFLFFKNPPLTLKNIVEISSPKRFITFSDNIFLTKILKEKNVSLFHSTGYALVKHPQNTKKILTVYDLTPLLFPKFFSLKHRLIFKQILKSGRYADKIICISENTKNDLLRFFPEYDNKIEIIYPFIEKDFCKKSDNNFTPPFKNYFLFVGGEDRVKNLKTILKALEINNFNLIISGKFSDNSIKSIYKNYPKLKERIHFSGYVDESKLSSLYKNAIALLYPSLNEGFGYPPLEALKCNTPSIVSKKGSLSEILKENAIYLKDPLNPEEISEKMTLIYNNPHLKDNILKDSFSLFSLYSSEAFKQKLFSLYRELEVL